MPYTREFGKKIPSIVFRDNMEQITAAKIKIIFIRTLCVTVCVCVCVCVEMSSFDHMCRVLKTNATDILKPGWKMRESC